MITSLKPRDDFYPYVIIFYPVPFKGLGLVKYFLNKPEPVTYFLSNASVQVIGQSEWDDDQVEWKEKLNDIKDKKMESLQFFNLVFEGKFTVTKRLIKAGL